MTTDQRNAVTSERMAAVRQKHTRPEIVVRKAAHGLGLRFRLHRRDLPGSPDIVFPQFKVAMFVHGCFWHRHDGCSRATRPKTNQRYWMKKFEDNIKRDGQKEMLLKDLGWDVTTIWECETFDISSLKKKLRNIFYIAPAGGTKSS